MIPLKEMRTGKDAMLGSGAEIARFKNHDRMLPT